MSIIKRASSPHWYIRFELQGRTVFESSGTSDKKQAAQLEHAMRTAIWAEAKLGTTQAATWSEGVAEWNIRKAHKRSLSRDAEIFDIAGSDWGALRLSQIDERAIAFYTKTLLEKTSPANTNRHLSQIRAFLRAMVAWKLLDKAPTIQLVKAPDYEPNLITREQFAVLLAELPTHVQRMALFGVETGLRYSNVARLRWESNGATVGKFEPFLVPDGPTVTVPGTSAKATKPIHIPLSALAWDTVKDLPRSPTGYVFTDHKGHGPVGSVKTAWLKARARAGLPRLRFHDLRHAWATWHLRAGTPEGVVQALGAWSSPDMVKRYGHMNTEDYRAYVK